MLNSQANITINRALGIVSEFSADPGNAPKWFSDVQSTQWKSPKPLKVGSQIVFKADVGGKKQELTYEVVEYFPGLKLVMKSQEGPVLVETTYAWVAKSSKETQMIIKSSRSVSGLSKILSPIMANKLKRAHKRNLKRLKAMLEKRS